METKGSHTSTIGVPFCEVGLGWGAVGLEMLAYLSGQNAKYQWAAGFNHLSAQLGLLLGRKRARKYLAKIQNAYPWRGLFLRHGLLPISGCHYRRTSSNTQRLLLETSSSIGSSGGSKDMYFLANSPITGRSSFGFLVRCSVTV